MKYITLIGLVFITMAQASPHSEFWSWFQANEARFPDTTEFDEQYGSTISELLTNVEDGLVYEIAIPEDGQKELIISADGILDLIPSVRNLVDAAPPLKGWDIIAFRPRLDDYTRFTLNYGDRKFDPKELWCWSRIDDGNFDLIIYHPDYDKEDRPLLANGTYLLLDMAIGEFDVMTGIRYIDHRELPIDPETDGLYKFAELRAVFDEFKSTVTH